MKTLSVISALAAVSAQLFASADFPFMVLRHSGTNDAALVRQIFDSSKKAGDPWDESWFYINQFLPLSEINARCDSLLLLRDECRKRGMAFSFQGISLGHGGFPRGMPILDETPENPRGSGTFTEADMIVDEDGHTTARPCPNSPKVRNYTYARAKLLLQKLRPASFWIDDDLRFSGGDNELYACFCQNCLDKFAEFSGRKYSRKELVKHLSQNVGTPEPLRAEWTRFCAKSLAEFASVFKKAADEVHPDCFLGLQTIHSRYKQNGESYAPILEAIRGVGGAGIRPGACNYTEGAARSLYSKIFDVAREAQDCRSLGFVSRITYECENYPRIAMLKSPEAFMTECALSLAAGCNSLSMYFYSGLNLDSPEIYDYFARTCARWKPYLKRVAAANENTELCGIVRPIGKNAAAAPKLDGRDRFFSNRATEAQMFALAFTGFPVCPENAAPAAFLLTEKSVNSLSDAELADALERSPIIDTGALAILKKRGVDLGAEMLPACSGVERIGKITYSNLKKCRPIKVDSANAEILAEVVSGGKSAGAALCILKTPKGANALVVGGAGFPEYPSYFRRKVFADALEKIGAKMPVSLDTPWRAAVFPRVDKNGKVVAITVMNLAAGRSLPLKLRVRNPKSDTPEWATPDGGTTPKTAHTDSPETLQITIPQIGAWEVGTLFF